VPDATVTLDFILQRMTGLIDKLVVHPENMARNLDRLGGLIHSQRVLIALTRRASAVRTPTPSCSATPWGSGRTCTPAAPTSWRA